jgi:hypothetical protein
MPNKRLKRLREHKNLLDSENKRLKEELDKAKECLQFKED